MKQFILPLIALLILGSANAQVQYESPHVKNGKTIFFDLPKGFFKIEDSDYEGNILFTTQEGIEYDEVEKERINLGMLAIINESTEESSFQVMIDELKTELIEPNKELVVLAEPEISKVNGRDFMTAAFKGEMEGEIMNAVYFSVTVFGDYNIIIAYYALEGIEDYLSYKSFKKIMASWKEVATTREDEMTQTVYSDEDFSDQDMFEDVFDTDYNNDFFDTQISYYDILPDAGENWSEPADDNTHLLSEFSFKENNGSIKIFSGGSFSNYSTDKEVAAAIQLVMDLPTRLSLKKDSEFSNEDHHFQLYSISGGGTITSVYSTLVNNELVFFVIDGGSNPVPDFKPAVRDFMLNMWIDYFEDAPEVPSAEK